MRTKVVGSGGVENQNIRFGTPRTLAKEATENQTEGGALVIAQ